MDYFLSPARRCLVENVTVYHPFGELLSRDSLRNYYGPKKEIGVLFLNCYDLRNVLLTIASKNLDHGANLNIHLNHSCPLSFARNVLLVKVFSSPSFDADNNGDINYLWDLWYNAVWPKDTFARFVVDVEDLIENGLPEYYFPMESSRIDELKETLNGWLSSLKQYLTQSTHVERILKQRSQYLARGGTGWNEFSSVAENTEINKMIEQQVAWCELAMIKKSFPETLKKKLSQEIKTYVETGNCNLTSNTSKCTVINPTLLEPKTFQWRVFIHSCPFKGYLPLQLNELVTTAEEGIATRYCQKILKNLVTSFKQSGKNVQIRFHYSDPLQLCLQGTSEKFDIIDSCSLADDVGLANLILSSIPRLAQHPSAILITESSMWCHDGATVQKYVERSLCTTLSLFPTIYGLRLTNHVELGLPTLHKPDTLLAGSPVTLLWCQAPRFENVTLDYSLSVECYLKKFESECFFREDGNDVLTKAHCGRDRYTPMTFTLALMRLSELAGKQKISKVSEIFKIHSAPQFTVARKTLDAWVDHEPVELLFSAQLFTPILSDYFAVQKVRFPATRLRIVLVPADLYFKETSLLQKGACGTGINWAAKIPQVHYIDNFNLNYQKNQDGSIHSALVSFLLPQNHTFARTHVGALVDIFSGCTQMKLGNIEDMPHQIYVKPLTISSQPAPPPKTVLIKPKLVAVKCQESENEYVVEVNILNCECVPKGLTISTDKKLPCEAGHSITLSLVQPEVKPLHLCFPYPILIDSINATLRSTERSIRLVMKKGLHEPWPCHFTEKPKWKVDSLGLWKEPKTKHTAGTQLMQHIYGMKKMPSRKPSCDSSLESKLSENTSLEEVRNLIATILVYSENGVENFVVYLLDKRDQPLWYIRAHLPTKVSSFGSPLILISALDKHLSEKLVKKGHIQAKQNQEDFNRIFDYSRQKNLFGIPIMFEDSTNLLRYVFRLNSTKMTPSTWQEENLSLGKYSPYLATFVTPLYLDNTFPDIDKVVLSEEQSVNLLSRAIGIPAVPQKGKSASSSICAACGKNSSGRLKRCSRCKASFYCSVECQRIDWPKHKPVCNPVCCEGYGEESDQLKRCSRCILLRNLSI